MNKTNSTPISIVGDANALTNSARLIAFLLLMAAALSVSAALPEPAGDTANRIHDSKFKNEVVEITLAPGEKMEYVLDIERGESLLYSWEVDKGNLYSDFHGGPTEKGEYSEGYWVRYEESEDKGAHGSIVSPFTGYAAWYWVNKNDHDVNITLELVGYFTGNRIEFRKVPE